jgi:crotonobetainyl-CoA:carnitine CoA-transferase CaiB-like acyl-CoA transferase
VEPFAGIRVIDLSTNRVGAQVSQLLADFGADVIQVERPGGAEIREHGAYPFWGRGKRSVVLDIFDDTDRDLVAKLAGNADIVIETFRPGVLDARDLGFEDLSKTNPKLIYTSITGFGSQGPMAQAPGYEGIVHAKLGAFHAFRRMSSNVAPPFLNVPFAGFAASQTALHGILAALFERTTSGLGQRVEANLLQGFMTLDTWAWFEHMIAARWPDAFNASDPYDSLGRPASPLTFMLMVAPTSEGAWMQFASVAPHLYAAKMKALGLDWMFTDPAWAGIPRFEDADKRMELWTKMLEAANSKTLAQWHAIFDADDNVFAEEFRTGAAILEHPQLLHDHMVADVVDTERGPVRQPGAIVKAAVTPAVLRSAPKLDENRSAILDELAKASESAQARHATETTSPSAQTAEASKALPLAGVTVLELATLFAAPHGTTMLTDLGARVIKVEPLVGDRIRTIIPFPESGGMKVMQGKESIAIDLQTPEGLAIIQEIASKVDVVVQGYRAGAMGKLGLDYQTVKITNPNVIYVNAPGYGVDGPYGGKPAYAPSIGAAAGLPLANVGSLVPARPGLSMAEIQDGARKLSAASAISNAQADGFAALGVSTAILFGLAARSLGAGGQELFSSMINTGAHAMSAQAVTYPGAPAEASPDDQLRGLCATYRVYDTADGYVFLAVPSQGAWERFISALSTDNEPAALRAPTFSTRESRAANDHALIAALSELFAMKPAAMWESELLPQGVGLVKVATTSIETVMYDETFGRASGYVADAVHPTFDEYTRLAPFVRFSRSETQSLPSVLSGQQTDSLLAEFGTSAEAIADLRSRSIVG